MNLDWPAVLAAFDYLRLMMPLASGLPAGVALGLACSAMVSQRRRAELKVYAALWEWGRQRPDGGAEHARRVQGYYRRLRSWRPPGELLAGAAFWAAAGLGAAGALVGGLGPTSAPADLGASVGWYGLGVAGGAVGTVGLRPLGIGLGAVGMAVAGLRVLSALSGA